MYIYNVTNKVHHSIAAAWLAWIKDEHTPDIIATGLFTHAVILHVTEADDEEGITYAVQYHCESKAFYNRYIENYAGEMRKKAFDKWGDKFIAFRSLMQVVN
jgi:hypothetical protein